MTRTTLPGDDADLAALIAAMTPDEKVDLLNGAGLWRSRAIARLGIPSIIMTDGAYGVRYSTSQITAGTDPADSLRQFLAVVNQRAAGDSAMFGTTRPATCFPNGNLAGCSWDADLIYQMGAALAAECRGFGVHLLLGPGINLRRTPLAGRAYEYYSEDPVISGDLAAALIRGLQDNGIGASLKHFACNNSEIARTTTSSDVGDRALREIYLAGFERAIAKAGPWTVMSAYNPLNGVQAAEHHWLLTTVLRDEWGYDGLVVSDWHAIKDRPAALRAGTDLDMPESPPRQARLKAAVASGELAPPVLDKACLRMLRLLRRVAAAGPSPAAPDLEAHHELARRIAAESIVLLRNENATLPLRPENLNLLVIGEGAVTPVIQGSGSATTNPFRVDTPLAEIAACLGEGATLRHLPFPTGPQAALAPLLAAARGTDAVLVFATHQDSREGEGTDRTTLHLGEGQDAAITALAQAGHRVIVVLTIPDAVEMPWINYAAAVLCCFYPGQGGGAALARVLSGRQNPCGKLTVTFPRQIGDIPGFLSYPGENGRHLYSEGIFAGYRSYDTRQIEPLFPFGHGLSYTAFRYETLDLSVTSIGPGDSVTATVTLRNTGALAGKEIVQIYVRPCAPALRRPLRELKGFAKVALGPGEAATVPVTLAPRDFQHFDPAEQRFVLRAGAFVIEAAASSRDIRLSARIACVAEPPALPKLTTSLAPDVILSHPAAASALSGLISRRLGLDAAQTTALLDSIRGSFLGIYDTLSWYIGNSLPEAELHRLFDDLNRGER